jgi:NADPH-dependent 2,4-dienoyl-CoA reductase/sulfur reductase-like enzyme
MTTPRDAGRVVIVGAGLAGYSAATELRALGHEGPITLVDGEPDAYDRPPLSKRLFDADLDLDSLSFATSEKLAEKRIDTVFGVRVDAIDPAAGTVTLGDGAVLAADTVLLTTGGRARALPVPGADLPRVHTLRTFTDAVAIRDAARPGMRAVVIGAGLIGAELASSLNQAGVRVTLIDPVTVPLIPAVGELLATTLHDLHTAHGVEVIVGVTQEIRQSRDGLTVIVADGPALPADVVVVGIGIVPDTTLARAAGLAVDDGIVVDDQYRTSAPNVFAAGDVARRRSADGTLHRREEHWEAAQIAGRHAAHGILGLQVPARGAPWFWSDRHNVHLEATGRLTGPGDLVLRAVGAHPTVFLVDDGVVVGAAAIDDNTSIRAARRLIDQRIPVSLEDLADPTVSLRSLLKAVR